MASPLSNMLSLFIDLWQQLISDLGLRRSRPRFYECEELAPVLRDLARREERTEEEVAYALVVSALAQRQKAEENLQRWKELSRREQEIVALACLGYTNKEIAGRLVISPETVKAHILHATRKFGLHSKAQLLLVLADWNFSAWDITTGTG